MKSFLLMAGVIMTLSLSTAVRAQIEQPLQQTEDYALFVTIKIKPGKVVEYKKVLLPYLEKVRAEAGILTYKVHQSTLPCSPDSPKTRLSTSA